MQNRNVYNASNSTRRKDISAKYRCYYCEYPIRNKSTMVVCPNCGEILHGDKLKENAKNK